MRVIIRPMKNRDENLISYISIFAATTPLEGRDEAWKAVLEWCDAMIPPGQWENHTVGRLNAWGTLWIHNPDDALAFKLRWHETDD